MCGYNLTRFLQQYSRTISKVALFWGLYVDVDIYIIYGNPNHSPDPIKMKSWQVVAWDATKCKPRILNNFCTSI